jgi:hypothetical protein
MRAKHPHALLIEATSHFFFHTHRTTGPSCSLVHHLVYGRASRHPTCNAGHFPSIALVKEPTFDKEAVFTNFGEQFKLNDKVIQHLLSLGMESLDDFYHYVSTTAEIEDKVTSRVASITDIAGLQAARLRKAWKSLGDALSQASKATALGQTGEDLDVPLAVETIDGAGRLR